MIIVLKQDAPDAQVREFCHELQDMGLQINDSKGSDTHILGLIGDTKAIAESWVLANPVVETCRRVTEPYKKANRKFHPDDSVIDVEGVKIGGGVLEQVLRKVEVECLPTDIAEKFEVDVSKLGLDQTLFVRDLQLGDKQTLVTRGELAVAVVKAPEGADAAAPGAAAGEEKSPEVIKKGKEDADAAKAEAKK